MICRIGSFQLQLLLFREMDLKSETGSKSFLALELKVPHVSHFRLKIPLSYGCLTRLPRLNFSQAGDFGLQVLVKVVLLRIRTGSDGHQHILSS